MTLARGTRLGPYEIVSAIGAGGMGEVFRARDPRLGRDVAVKVLPASFATDAERLRRFEQEARAAGVLNHPNVTAVLDIGRHEGAPYVVQELLEGETLRQELAGGRIPQRHALDYALQIAHGLAAAHDKGIVHRDLKPENLFVTRDGRVKILDFGLAKLAREDAEPGSNLPTATGGTEPGVVLGTLGYMAPEQVKGRPADARSDIFAFGAILYEMLSGRRAFQGDSAAETMSAILREEPPDLSAASQAVSPGLERIVRRCLEKSPERRFQSASDLGFAIEATTGDASASRVSAAAGRPRLGRRGALLAAGFAAAAVAGALLGWSLRAPASPPTFRRLTYHRGYVESARFSPDGETVLFGSTRGNQPLRLEATRLDGVESRPVDVPAGATVVGVSRSGDMALLLGCRHRGYWVRTGTLARVAIGGGIPREILEHVGDADLSPDGREFAVVREVGRRQRLEFPIGKVILETDGWISHPRISPDGARVAFLEHPVYGDDGGFVSSAPAGGKPRRLTKEWQGAHGLAWTPDGKEIWFAAGGEALETGARYQIWAVGEGGASRLVYGPPADVWLHDISAKGVVLFSREDSRGEIGGLLKGDAKERDLSTWSDEAVSGISEDGSAYAGIEQSAPGAGLESVLYYRRAGESAPVRVGNGNAGGMSSDGRWIAALRGRGRDATLVLVPTGPGEPRTLALGSVTPHAVAQEAVRWSHDGRWLIFSGSEPGKLARTWLVDLAGDARPRAVTPEGCSMTVLSPDAASVATVDPDGRMLLFSVSGGAGREVRGSAAREIPLEWEAGGRALFVWDRTWPARIERLDLESGRRTPWKELAPDPTGVLYGNVFLTRDGQHYVYRLRRDLSELSAASGLR